MRHAERQRVHPCRPWEAPEDKGEDGGEEARVREVDAEAELGRRGAGECLAHCEKLLILREMCVLADEASGFILF